GGAVGGGDLEADQVGGFADVDGGAEGLGGGDGGAVDGGDHVTVGDACLAGWLTVERPGHPGSGGGVGVDDLDAEGGGGADVDGVGRDARADLVDDPQGGVDRHRVTVGGSALQLGGRALTGGRGDHPDDRAGPVGQR